MASRSNIKLDHEINSDKEYITWKHVKEICDECERNNEDLKWDILNNDNRSKEVSMAYTRWKLEGKKELLYNTIFGSTDKDIKFDLRSNHEDIKFDLRSNHEDTHFDINHENIVIRLNDFPYNFECGLIHYVVWIRPHQINYKVGPRMDQELLGIVYKEIKTLEPNMIEMVHFRNHENLRTIETIDHYHVIVKIGSK